MKVFNRKAPATGTLLTNAESVSPAWRIPNRHDTGEFEPQRQPEPTLVLDCPLFELTPEGAAHWMAEDGWTQGETALLLAGANPLRIREFDADPNTYKPDFTSCGHLGLTLRLQRAREMGVLAFPCPPLQILGWAKSKHAIPAVFESRLPVSGEPAPATHAATLAPVVVPLDSETWETQARERASDIIKRHREKDLYPSQINIADQIAKEFRTAGVVGVDGKPLTGATIKRHALNGISSAQGKKLSTRTGRGK